MLEQCFWGQSWLSCGKVSCCDEDLMRAVAFSGLQLITIISILCSFCLVDGLVLSYTLFSQLTGNLVPFLPSLIIGLLVRKDQTISLFFSGIESTPNRPQDFKLALYDKVFHKFWFGTDPNFELLKWTVIASLSYPGWLFVRKFA